MESRRTELASLLIGSLGSEMTAAQIAARHHVFNAQGLWFDVPGTEDWPSIIVVGLDGRFLDEDALEVFFGIDRKLAEMMVDHPPSHAMLDRLEVLVN